MKKAPKILIGFLASFGMLALILDSRTALTGAADGIDLCLKTVIPALFPFFVLSQLLTGAISGTGIAVLRPLGKLCGIPAGAESILIAGLTGGYPVGAQCIAHAHLSGRLSKSDAQRMLGFCNNAGPAFIFGMSGILFENVYAPPLLWVIHILSAVATAAILPGKSTAQITPLREDPNRQGHVLYSSMRGMATVCGWVIIFRVIIAIAQRWFLWLLPPNIRIFIIGCFELTNGYIGLTGIPNDLQRFALASIFLALGGLCVGMQTISIIGQAGLTPGSYFPGKLIQAAISAAMAIPVASSLFSNTLSSKAYGMAALIIALSVTATKILKNSSSILRASGV